MTNNLGQIVLFDWMEFTFFDEIDIEENVELDPTVVTVKSHFRIQDYFTYFFGIMPSDVSMMNRAQFGYDYTYYHGGIKLLYSDRRTDMGIHVVMSGQACREFEELGLSWYSFLEKALHHKAHFTRVDVAIDDFTKDYLTIRKLYKCVREGRVVSKFKIDYETTSRYLEDGSIKSETIQFGSRASLIQIVFYNKLLERKNANYLVSDAVMDWFRCELRFRHERADLLIGEVINGENRDIALNNTVKGVLSNYIKFCDKSPTESNRSRWKVSNWWTTYLENLDNLKLTLKHPESTIVKKKAWIEHSVSLTQFQVFISSMDNISVDNNTSSYLYDVLVKGYEKMDKDSLYMINNYRIMRGLEPFTMSQIEDYIRDIKDIIVLRESQYLDD